MSTRREGIEDRIWFNSGGGEKFKDWTRAVIGVNAEEETCYQVCINRIILAIFEKARSGLTSHTSTYTYVIWDALDGLCSVTFFNRILHYLQFFTC